MSILVAGGAGYIGAHVVRLLQERGEEVLVVDDLSYGTKERIGKSELLQLDVSAPEAPKVLEAAMREHNVTGVIHFAARKQVGESVEKPMWYYQQNVGGLANMLIAMEAAGVKKMIFSSSAAVYGMPPVEVVSEDIIKQPINPYGETKLIGEWMMADCERAWGLNWAGLRYFNVAGSGWDDLGDPATLNLIPMVLDRLARGESPKIFGDDYPTPDGTCIRDYIHVLDLAKAHLAALDYLGSDRISEHHVFNVGTGQGNSVKEVIDQIAKTTGLEFETEILGRRAGDPPQLIGDPSRIGIELGWKAQHYLPEIIESAWSAWQAGPRRIER
ncbi:UDP-glucose 4-epimerase GalE [Boudabousia liubingyangii]|uniref:UDP-glucose 4-epimerase n=1 Tax=Boudabousia liubingyangii TaxID=1921764 RepID=A0A1Q5PKY5_9ACTO|nr:UDP-glucose 4-epimerase GalE [Boudabousia liubingyangii]OKL46381.1 UDP-glucose 4-epimerase GalE [Boudabousia liubingyangii]OKL47296.1 UDP-glucose 4-epimerase GalE [Boudabousia liubingyangii]